MLDHGGEGQGARPDDDLEPRDLGQGPPLLLGGQGSVSTQRTPVALQGAVPLR
jgi:hypothetical protein